MLLGYTNDPFGLCMLSRNGEAQCETLVEFIILLLTCMRDNDVILSKTVNVVVLKVSYVVTVSRRKLPELFMVCECTLDKTFYSHFISIFAVINDKTDGCTI